MQVNPQTKKHKTALLSKEKLLKKIHDQTATVGVVGVGYVGLPLAVEKAKAGYSVVAIDQNVERVAKLNRGGNYIPDVNDLELSKLVSQSKIRAVSDYSVVKDLDIIVICVPTPLTKNLTPDLTSVESVTRAISAHLRPGQLISLESTTYPGTTTEIMLPILTVGGLKPDQDFFLVHSPERVDPGNKRYKTANTIKVLGGIGPDSLDVAYAFYSKTIKKVIPVSSASVAEMTKVFENTFRAVNIALVNELAMFCDRAGFNVWEVLDAAFTKPFGILPFYPGPGVGGHCIPLDPHYLEWKAKEHHFNMQFIGLAGEINRGMPQFVCEKASRILNKKGLALSRSKILLLGIGYKKDLGDVRESPALEVFQKLKNEGAEVSFHDPYVPVLTADGLVFPSTPLNENTLKQADLVIITTAHSAVDYDLVLSNATHVLDTRFATRGMPKGKAEVTLL